MTEFEQYIDHLVAAATIQGLSQTNNVLFSPVSGNLIFLGYAEPSGYVLPLNVLWVQANPQSAEYKRVRQRTSKQPSSPMANTWTQVTSMSAVTQPQFWDPSDTPAPQIISGKGGTLSGRIFSAGDVDRFQPLEFVTRSYVDDRLALYFLNMGLKVDGLVSEVNAVKQAQTATNLRVTALEGKLGSTLVFKQETEAAIWTLAHNLGAGYGVAICVDEEGRNLWPESSGVGPNPNTFVVRFLQPVSGSCLLTYVPTR